MVNVSQYKIIGAYNSGSNLYIKARDRRNRYYCFKVLYVYKDLFNNKVKIKIQYKEEVYIKTCNSIVPLERLLELLPKNKGRQYRRMKLPTLESTEIYTTQELAEKLHYSPQTLRTLSDKKLLDRGYYRLGKFHGQLLFVRRG